MPTISIFYGILIHTRTSHFHALYAEHEALIEYLHARSAPRELPKRALVLVLVLIWGSLANPGSTDTTGAITQKGTAMRLRDWWRGSRERADANRRSLAINDDRELISQQVPELADMTDVESMAYILQQIDEWNKTCSPEQAITFARRLMASNESFKAEGLTMPHWGTLWVLRTY